MRSYHDEFPSLQPHGLYAADIRGDGNCLFNALSDQLYGTQDEHATIRARVIDFMRANAQLYKSFIEVSPGGGVRRNPKRKNARGYSTPSDASAPSPAEVDRVFEAYLRRMAQGGTYGDNVEIAAFAQVYEADVMIWQRDVNIVVSGPAHKLAKPLCHIAYHTWEHYSSVRNLKGPHPGQGLPNVSSHTLSPAQQADLDATLARASKVHPWQVRILQNSGLDPPPEHDNIVRLLRETNGDLNMAISKLYGDLDETRSVSSAQSSSVEREIDSGDESLSGPKKKQDRRISRASKAALKVKLEECRQETGLKLTLGKSLESLIEATKQCREPPLPRQSWIVVEDSEDDWSSVPLKDGDTSSGSEYSTQTDPEPTVTKIRLRLSHPAADATQQSTATNSDAGPVRSNKRVLGASARKDLKKQAQKAAAKERRQLAAKTSKSTTKLEPALQASTHPTMTTAIRTLYI